MSNINIFNIRNLNISEDFTHYVINISSIKGVYGKALILLMYRFANLDKPVKIILQANELIDEYDVEQGIFHPNDIGQVSGFVFVSRYGGVFRNIELLLIPKIETSNSSTESFKATTTYLSKTGMNIIIGYNLTRAELLEQSLVNDLKMFVINLVTDDKGSYNLNHVYITPDGLYYDINNHLDTENGETSLNSLVNFEEMKQIRGKFSKNHQFGYNAIFSSMLFNLVNAIVTQDVNLNYMAVKGNLNAGITEKSFVMKEQLNNEISRLLLLLNKDFNITTEHDELIKATLVNSTLTSKNYLKILLDMHEDVQRTNFRTTYQSMSDVERKREIAKEELRKTYLYLRKILQMLKQVFESEEDERLRGITIIDKLYNSDEDVYLFKQIYTIISHLNSTNSPLHTKWIQNTQMEVFTLLVFIEEYYGNFYTLAKEEALLAQNA